MSNLTIEYFPEKTPFRVSSQEYPDCLVYIDRYFSTLNATSAHVGTETGFYIVGEERPVGASLRASNGKDTL